jgi:death-on-curing protein
VTAYLTVEDVLRQLARLGFEVRDAGLLASAVLRPQASAFGRDAYPDIWAKAAALCQSLDHNQGLRDGNKRLAWMATKTFLYLNGWYLKASAADGLTFMLGIVNGGAELVEIASWLHAHSESGEAPTLPHQQ